MSLSYRLLPKISSLPVLLYFSRRREVPAKYWFELVVGNSTTTHFSLELNFSENTLLLVGGEKHRASFVRLAELPPFRTGLDDQIRVNIESSRILVQIESNEIIFDDTPVISELTYIGYSSNFQSDFDQRDLSFSWRFCARRSGYGCDDFVGSAKDGMSTQWLRPGFSFVIRAKNEATNIERCIRSLKNHRDEIIFIDNNSTDATYSIANRLKSEIFNLKTFHYNVDIPRAGKDHAQAVWAGSTNTLGHYYNFALSKVSRFNFTKWDADYIALASNLEDMIETLQLRTRGDNFSLWFSGHEVFTDHKRYWLDTRSRHSEWRAFSKKCGQKWVNILPWEEVEQSYIYKSVKYMYSKPVYVELFELADRESADRGVFIDDVRDRERLEFIRQFKEYGELRDDRFVEIEGLDMDFLSSRPLSEIEVELGERKLVSYAQVPEVAFCDRIVSPKWTVNACSLAILVLSCEARAGRRDWIRWTWGQQCADIGVPVYFIVGRPGQQSAIVGDTIYLDVEDNYESLPIKVCQMFAYACAHIPATHYMKVDDDIALLANNLYSLPLKEIDFAGGRIVHKGARLDWHTNKCENWQLNDVPIEMKELEAWFDGGSTYILSQQAAEIVAQRTATFQRMLYEDQAVAVVLGKTFSAHLRPPYQTVYACWKHGEQRPSGNFLVVGDVPSLEVMKSVVAASESVHNPSLAYEAHCDWMDFADISRRLNLRDSSESDPFFSGPSGIPRTFSVLAKDHFKRPDGQYEHIDLIVEKAEELGMEIRRDVLSFKFGRLGDTLQLLLPGDGDDGATITVQFAKGSDGKRTVDTSDLSDDVNAMIKELAEQLDGWIAIAGASEKIAEFQKQRLVWLTRAREVKRARFIRGESRGHTPEIVAHQAPSPAGQEIEASADEGPNVFIKGVAANSDYRHIELIVTGLSGALPSIVAFRLIEFKQELSLVILPDPAGDFFGILAEASGDGVISLSQQGVSGERGEPLLTAVGEEFIRLAEADLRDWLLSAQCSEIEEVCFERETWIELAERAQHLLAKGIRQGSWGLSAPAAPAAV